MLKLITKTIPGQKENKNQSTKLLPCRLDIWPWGMLAIGPEVGRGNSPYLWWDNWPEGIAGFMEPDNKW